MIRLAVFDCDGTLVDSQANICRAMEACFIEHRLVPPGRDSIRRIVGLSLVPAIAQLHPQGDAEQHVVMADAYKRAFWTMRSDRSLEPEPLFEGVAEAIEALHEAGWVLGVATGKSDRGLGHILDHHGLRHRFLTLQTADRHPSKPHPAMLRAAMAEVDAAPESTVMIGDTSFDIEMAVAAGAHPVGVAWGYHASAELHAAGARDVLGHARDLPALMEAL